MAAGNGQIKARSRTTAAIMERKGKNSAPPMAMTNAPLEICERRIGTCKDAWARSEAGGCEGGPG